MSPFPVLLVILFIAAAQSQSRPMLPDLAACRLSHAFVLGESWNHPGAIEIWECHRETVITLTQFHGPWDALQRQLRSHVTAEVAAEEKVVGCKNEVWLYSGVVAVASDIDGAHPIVSRAWKADLENWVFEETTAEEVVCNGDFRVR
jgi:hypothetical protein